MIDNFVLPFAFRADSDIFRKQIEDPKIRRLLIKYADDTKNLYARYAVEDARKKRKRPRMTAFTFSQCMLDKHIQDVTFNSEKVLGVVHHVLRTSTDESKQDTETVDGSLAANPRLGAVNDDEDLSYEAFEESLIAIACHKFPDPYISLESRVEKFFSFYVREQRGDGGASADSS